MSKFVTGIFGMEDEEYFLKGGLSNSDFRLLKESALHYENHKLFRLEGMRFTFGSALHCKVLEPEKFAGRYAVESFKGDHLNKNSNAYKDAKKDWLRGVGKKDVLSGDEYRKILRMSENVLAIAGSLLSNGEPERAMLAPINGVQMKGRADYISESLRLIVDIKTTASIKDFPKSMVDYGYLSQAALYSDLMKEITGNDYKFIFVMVEGTQPHMVRVAQIGQEGLEIGREIYTEMISKLKLWEEDKVADVLKTVNPPNWYLTQRGYAV